MERPARSGVVTLLTDFGLSDTYVGQMKGVMLGIEPGLKLVDLTHAVPAQDILEGAFQLATAWQAFPRGTVHLAVVDPGVGSTRRAISFLFDDHYFVLPDNGLGSLVLGKHEADLAIVLNPPGADRPPAPTFHGRDIFAPAAARLAGGATLPDLGAATDPASIVRLEVALVRATMDGVEGPVISIDRFGNCRTLIGQENLPAGEVLVRCNGVEVRGISRTYGDVDDGQPLALMGSHGGLEISVRNGGAAERFGIERGMLVRVTRVRD